MNVTDEQAKAAVFCFGDGTECTDECIQSGLHGGCIGDVDTDAFICSVSADLLEARAMIRLFREKAFAFDCYSNDLIRNTAKYLLDISKEYAE